MAMRRLPRMIRVTNKQMLLQPRREPYKPVMASRHEIAKRTMLEQYERRCAEGVVFVPAEALPPWKKTLALNARRVATEMNIRGLRVRAVDTQDEPGFATHFR